MFSSLPSASKIYQSSVKPHQKSASSAKKRRKKLHSDSNQHASILDDSVVSLVACEQDSLSVLPVIDSQKNLCDHRIHNYERENSSSEINLYSVKTCDVNSRITDTIPEQGNHVGITCQIEELYSENLSVELGSKQNEVLTKQLNENEQHDFSVSSTEESSKISYPLLVDEKLQEEFEAVQSPEVLLADSDLQDLSCDKDCYEEIKFDPTSEKDNSKMTYEEVEAAIEHETLNKALIKAVQINETEDENFIHPGDLKSDAFMEFSKSLCAINQNNPERSNVDSVSTIHNIALEENIDSCISQVENVTLLPQFDGNIESSSDSNDAICTTRKENTDSAAVIDSETQLNIISDDPDINYNCFSDNFNNSKENIENWINDDSSDQIIEVSIVKESSGLSMRTQSPEQSELSCTESVLCEAKDYHQEDLCPEIKSNSIKKSKDSILSSQKQKESNIKGSAIISQSFSNLLCDESQTTVSSRCSSLPEGLHLSKMFVDKHSQSTVPTVLDKATITADLECKNNSEECLAQRNFSYVEDQNETSEQPLAKNSISGLEDKSSLWNALPPLAMVKARTRSYVFGCKGPTGSLLGSDELSRVFPENQVTVFVGTWNMNGHDPPQSMDDFLLPLTINTLPDIYAIGVQESMQSRLEWEVLLQTTLGPSHVLFTSTSLGVLHLCIFLRRDLIWFCSEPEETSVATRPGTMVKTKGAVAVCFMCFGTSFLFVNSHLTAHEQKLKERLSDYEKIISSLELPKSIPLKNHSRDKDVTSRFDCVFWCGDLNFRVMHDRPSVLSFVEEKVRNARPSCSFLVKRDQLHKAMEEGRAFHGFKESVIHFIPSYKFDVGTSTFNSSKLRVPSYTDRILYRSKEKSSVSCLYYNAVPDISTSDHKPVYAVFKVALRPGRDNVPLAAGMFKRDVYLEAIKRRSKFLEVRHNQGQSAICSLM